MTEKKVGKDPEHVQYAPGSPRPRLPSGVTRRLNETRSSQAEKKVTKCKLKAIMTNINQDI